MMATPSEHAPNPSHRRGHTIRAQHNKDNARVINGDVFNITSEDLLSLLPCATGAGFDALNKDHETSCLPGTRIQVLSQINTWSKDGSDTRCVFWLSGMAGTGKSTVARTVAREHHQRKRLGGSFFFSRGGGEAGNARSFFTTIAFQLTRTSAALKRYVLDALDENRDIAKRALTEQWRLLILEPLAIARKDSSQLPLLLVIDALDECDSGQDVRLILKLLASANTHISSTQLRVLVTSRPDTSIRLGFRDTPGIWHRDLVLNDVLREVVDNDIAIYFSEELKDIRRQLDRQIIGCLVDKACGLFIWATTACRFIKNGKLYAMHARKRLSLILEGVTDQRNPEKELDQIYTKILSESLVESQEKDDNYELDEDEFKFKCFRRVVGSIIILFQPLSTDALGSLLRTSASEIQREDIEEILSHLQSVLDVPTSSVAPIRLLHPSFRDFLLSEKRCQETQLQVDERLAHRTLANDCIALMSDSLRRDVCGFQRPGTLLSDGTRDQVEQCIRPELQYACLYWVQHLRKSDIMLHDEDEVDGFLRLHLLHWLEALAWLGRTSEAILALISLEAQIQADKSPRLHEAVRDAKRFAVYYRRIIEKAPLQLYCSALIFAPENSVIRRQFHQDMPGWIRTKPKVQQHWNAALHTLEGHVADVTSVAFSSDSKWVASGSMDGTVRLWDAATGAALQTLEGHSSHVTSVAISVDGKSVVSGSWDKTVRLWDAKTGAVLQTLETCSHYVSSIAYSTDGQLVASRSRDTTVLIWHAGTGAALQTLEGHTGYVTSVAFSRDGKVVIGSGDRVVRLWNVATGAAVQTLKGYSDYVKSVTFSRDNRLVVSWSLDNTVQLWEAATGAALKTLEGHSASVTSAAFSPDGTSIVSGSADGIVRLWDVATGETAQKLEGHSACVTCVSISSDGRSVVSGSRDGTVRLWDAKTGAALQTLESGNWVTAVAFSSDAKLVVARFFNGELMQWHGTTGAKLGRFDDPYDWSSVAFSLNGELIMTPSAGGRSRCWTEPTWDPASGADRWEPDSGYVGSVAFSTDGRSIVSGSDDGKVQLWEAATGAALQTLEGHCDDVRSVAFSPDGRSVVSGSDDRSVQLWDVATGMALQTIEGHSEVVTSVAFSPDGKSVASGSDDGTVRLWDAETGAAMQKLEGHCGRVRSVAFSPDATSIVSGSADSEFGLADTTVRLWNVATDATLQPLEGHSDQVMSVAFSLDGRSIVSGSADKTVRLWDAATGTALRTLEGHSGEVTSVAFCIDGRSVVSASNDRTVRVWNVVTGALLWTRKCWGPWWPKIAVTPNGKSVVCSRFDTGEVQVWDVATGTEIYILRAQDNFSSILKDEDDTLVAFSADGRLIATEWCGPSLGMVGLSRAEDVSITVAVGGSLHHKSAVPGWADGKVWLWEATTGAAVQTLKGHSEVVTSVAFSPDGRSVVSGSDDRMVRLWDVATGAALQTLTGHSEVVTSVAFSPDGKSLASGSDDRTVRLWDVATGAALHTLKGHSGNVRSVVFSPDGKWVLSGSQDCTLRLWDAATGTVLQTLECQYFKSIAFSSDGNLIVSRFSRYITDYKVQLWEAATGAALMVFDSNHGPMTSPTVSAAGDVVDTLHLSGHWIKQGEENIVWLPPDHRGQLVGSHMGAIVLTQSSGRIIIMRFRSGPKVV